MFNLHTSSQELEMLDVDVKHIMCVSALDLFRHSTVASLSFVSHAHF